MDVEKLSLDLLNIVANSVIDRMVPPEAQAIAFTASEVLVVSKWILENFGSAGKEVNPRY